MQVDYMEILGKIVRCHNVTMTLVKEGEDETPDFDLGIRKALLTPGEKETFIREIYRRTDTGILYYVKDYFEVEYCIFQIPEEERDYGDFIIIGPYRESLLDGVEFQEMLEDRAIPRAYTNELKEYYHAVPTVSNLEQWRELCISMARTLYGEERQIRTEYVSQSGPEYEYRYEVDADTISYKMIEERYAAEGEMLKAISLGNTEEALKRLNHVLKYKIAARYKDPIRDHRNGLIIVNTLFRKAAEAGNVHPAHIDQLSTQLAKRIETVNFSQESSHLMAEMVRKYCMLVRNYSLRGCSPVIQKVVNHINLNLTGDLSLKLLAAEYSVNASYLSSLFKKEMGLTLSDYVCQQRIRHAIKLLNSTNMQIQDIASESGIYDVNYFRKTFKKITGMTPTEYVKEIKRQS